MSGIYSGDEVHGDGEGVFGHPEDQPRKPSALAEAKLAIAYMLSQIQMNPDLRWIMLDTEAMAKLMRAEAILTGRSEQQVRDERRKDLQPEHRRRQADAPRLRKQIEDIQGAWDELRYSCVPGGSGHTMVPDTTLGKIRAAIYPGCEVAR